MNITAVMRGGPADGQVMRVRDMRDLLVDQLTDQAWFKRSPEDLIETVPTTRYRYEPVSAVVVFEVGGVS